MSAQVNMGLFFVEVQQAIVAVGTFCDLDDLDVSGSPAKDQLARLLVSSLDIQEALREWRFASMAAIESLRNKGADLHADRLLSALTSIGAQP